MRVLILALALGCSIDPPDGRFACDDDGDCPAGFACVLVSGESRCFRSIADAGTDRRDSTTDAPADMGPADIGADLGPGDTSVDSDGPDAGPPFLVTFGGVGDDIAEGVAVDAMDNVYVVGSFQGTADFGVMATSSGSDDAFLASFTSAGELRHLRTFGGTGKDTLRAIVEQDGRICVAGVIVGAVDVGGGPEDVGPGQRAALVACYNAVDGSHIWSHAFDVAEARDIAINADQIVVAGEFSGMLEFGAATLMSMGANDVFVASWSLDGVFDWVNTAGDVGEDVGRSVAINAAGHVGVGGEVTDAGEVQAFLGRYTDAGLRSEQLLGGTSGSDAINGIDSSGLTLCGGGLVSGEADFGSDMRLVPPIGGDPFVACFGTLAIETRWVTGFDTSMRGVTQAVALDSGHVWGGGDFQGTIDLGVVPSAGGRDGFVVELALLDGAVTRAFTLGGAGEDEVRALQPHAGGVYAAGAFSEDAAFGAVNQMAVGGKDAFVVLLR